MKTIYDMLGALLKGEVTPTQDEGTGAIVWAFKAGFQLEVYLPEYARRPFSPKNVRSEEEHRKYKVLNGDLTALCYEPVIPDGAPEFVALGDTSYPTVRYVAPLLKTMWVAQAYHPSDSFQFLATDLRQFIAMTPTTVLVEKTSPPVCRTQSLQKYPWYHDSSWMGVNPQLMCNHLHTALVKITVGSSADALLEALK